MGRRIQPLLLILLLGGVVLVARLWNIQIVHNAVWADEAARLLHSGHVLKYERGRILASDGSVMVRDKPTYHLFLVYRDFRRSHPLGQVAHARSLLEGRAVSLPDTAERLEEWALDLVHLTPEEIENWSLGDALVAEGWNEPALEGDRQMRRDTARSEHRRQRVADLHFYLRNLLGLESRQWRLVDKRIKRSDGQVSFLSVAAAEHGETEEELLLDLRVRLVESMQQLSRFAVLARLEEDGIHASDADLEGLLPLDLAIGEIERARRFVEDAAASKLFAEAAGFSAGRLTPETLLTHIDLQWIADLFAWDEERLGEWAETARNGWTASWRDGWALPRLHADLVLDKTRSATPEDVLDRLTALFSYEGGVGDRLDARFEPEQEALNWELEERQCVLDSLEEWLAVDVPLRLQQQRLLPFRDPELRRLARELRDEETLSALDAFQVRPNPWELLDAAVPVSSLYPKPTPMIEVGDLGTWLMPSLAARVAGVSDGVRLGRLFAAPKRKRSQEDLAFELTRRMAQRWDAAFQDGLSALLDELIDSADGPRELSSEGLLVIAPSRRDRAIERADYYLKDFGLRPRALTRTEPDYEVVHILTRFAKSFPGIEAQEAWEREVIQRVEDSGPLAAGIIGHTSAVDERLLVQNRAGAQRLRELWNQPRRGQAEEEELYALVGQVLLPDEVRGVSGVEGFFDPELRGANGYREEIGLQEVREAGVGRRRKDPTNGEDLRLTLNLNLQRAAERVLSNPILVPADPSFDAAWAANPVGAIVMITADGDILVSASEPTPFEDPGVNATGQRANPIERTLRLPNFQPPGSVIKPLMGWYALSRKGLEPTEFTNCASIGGRGAGYVDLHCWKPSGHGRVNLHQALLGSCNAYFARVGESMEPSEFMDLASIFGLDSGTGVRTAPPWADGLRGRLGLREDVDQRVFKSGNLTPREERMAGNGLGVLNTTPMQLARAFAALGTGNLPNLRIVEQVGARDIPREPGQPVPLDEGARRRIVSSLLGVTNDRKGTGFKALSKHALGFHIAAKTGSADFTSRNSESDRLIRKHTWVAGFAPVENPEVIFVVFVHDTVTTSSHGAVYLAEAFLQSSEVRAYLRAKGMEVGDFLPR
ncbi:MAG: cell division protein FtsI/penicillin-binding protein 2 [Planctomycetota bacterium]|jgi:cell division protein FtsI/penicillin-binding protein 2